MENEAAQFPGVLGDTPTENDNQAVACPEEKMATLFADQDQISPIFQMDEKLLLHAMWNDWETLGRFNNTYAAVINRPI
jgi:hypothetical protein